MACHQGREGGEAEAEGGDGGAVLALRSQGEDAARRPHVPAGSRWRRRPFSSGHALSYGSSHYTLALHPTLSEFISIHLR